MKTCARYFAVLEPEKADGDGLVQCLGKALQSMGIEDLVDSASVLSDKEQHPTLVGGGTDGGAVNMSEQNGMKGKLQHVMPWLFLVLVLSTLTRACIVRKNALSSQLFQDVEEMLLRLYYPLTNQQ